MTTKKPVAVTRYIKAMLMLASEADIHEGKEWYRRAYELARRLMATYDVTLGQAVGVIAALSPNNKWERNCQDAESLIKAYWVGADPLLVKVCTFNKNKQKAIDILNLSTDVDDIEFSHSIQAILSGRKVVAFYRCIMGFDDTVCVDGHAYAIWIGERIPTTKTPSISAPLYQTITRAYVNVAKDSPTICGEKLTPAQVQAVTWVTYRRLIKG